VPDQPILTEQAPIEPPNGLHNAHVDDKGRLKLPEGFKAYFGALKEKKLYITTVDAEVGQIYPIASWRLNRNIFNDLPDPELAARVSFLADEYGGDSEMDGQGRILLPVTLRRFLEVENQNVKLRSFKGHIEILSERVYLARKNDPARNAKKDADALFRAGMQ
jgi:DNA-binding transcriptional regulator/RsmH inhibitor MraZ